MTSGNIRKPKKVMRTSLKMLVTFVIRGPLTLITISIAREKAAAKNADYPINVAKKVPFSGSVAKLKSYS